MLGRLSRVRKEDVGIPPPVVAEIAYGIERLPRSARRDRLQHRFSRISGEISRIPWTDSVSESFGHIKAVLERRGQRIEDFDAAIAAHALAIDGVLVTANLAHMSRIPGLDVEDWSG